MAAGAYTDPNGQANSVALRTEMITGKMDEIIAVEAKTNGMTADPAFVQATSQANVFKVATLSTSGLGDYDKQKGYPRGTATLEWNSYELKHDRGVVLDIDRLDQAQSGGLASTGSMAAYLTRNQIIPEIDATRIAGVYSAVNTSRSSNVKASATALAKTDILSAIEEGIDTIANKWAVDSGYTIYVNMNLKSTLRGSSEFQRVRDIAGGVAGIETGIESIDGNRIVYVPSERMKTAYTYNDGVTDGETAGGFAPASGAGDVNFMILAPGVANGVVSVNAEKYITKEVNQIKDADALYVRLYHDVIVTKESTVGAYVSVKTAADREPESGGQTQQAAKTRSTK